MRVTIYVDVACKRILNARHVDDCLRACKIPMYLKVARLGKETGKLCLLMSLSVTHNILLGFFHSINRISL